MKYFLIVGEASGDSHAATLMEALLKQDTSAKFAGLGGPLMRKQGLKCYQDYTKMAFMGVWAILCNLKQIKQNFQIAEQALLDEKPDVLILVDYPSFNLKIAEFARKHLPQIKIVYFIPPKVWAWKTKRIHKIAKLCDEVLGIFPFEPDFYATFGYKCRYIGNPTAEAIAKWQASLPAIKREEMIALLPGSRKNEIRNCLPKMLKAAQDYPYPVVIAAAPGLNDDFYQPYLAENISLTRNTWQLLAKAKLAVVTSGTATLEAALLGCPQTAVYRIILSRWLGWLRPFIFKLKQFTLVNIVAGKEVIYEAIGPKFSTNNIRHELKKLLTDEAYKQNMLAQYKHIQSLLGTHSAAETAAKQIKTLMQSPQ